MASLRYVTSAHPGITRHRQADQFVYRDSKGRLVRQAATLDRIRTIVVPPAWTDVWICPDPNGHLQATGRDARGRKQYRYHPRWNAARDAGKYDHMIEFAHALPEIRRQVEADMKKPALSREHLLAAVVKLLDKTLIRIGNKEYARANRSFGLTTLRDHHVSIKGNSVAFDFRAKSGVMQHIELNDPAIARIVRKYRSLPGRALFQYVDERGNRQCIDSADVNRYLKGLTGRPFTAKNFRTWAGSVLVAEALCEVPPSASEASFKRNVAMAVDLARQKLGNTRAVCRKSYVHPGVLNAYRSGITIEGKAGPRRLHFSASESAVLALLRRRSAHREAA